MVLFVFFTFSKPFLSIHWLMYVCLSSLPVDIGGKSFGESDFIFSVGAGWGVMGDVIELDL